MELMTAIFYVSVAYICWKVVGHCLSLPRISNLDSLFILITGCDSGFGHEAAKRLDAMGCQVIAGCLTEKGETILRKECSDRLRTIYLDVSKRESVQQAFDLVSAMLPRDSGIHVFSIRRPWREYILSVSFPCSVNPTVTSAQCSSVQSQLQFRALKRHISGELRLSN